MSVQLSSRIRSVALMLATAMTFCFSIAAAHAPPTATAPAHRPWLLVHYMPWFQAMPHSPAWGWHWTMNRFNPEKIVNGRREIASHFTPLIGPYDSDDPHVIEYHLLLMKLSGIDGVIVDWYGLEDFRDYAMLHRNTQRLIELIDKLGMKFAICYEDQTITALVEGGVLKRDQRIAHVTSELQWLARNWFPRDSYVRLNGDPLLLSFGTNGLTDAEWTECLSRLKHDDRRIAYFSEHHRRSSAIGAFDWPQPAVGIAAQNQFDHDAKSWPQSIPVVYPRFVDIYAHADVGPGYGRIEDDNGDTFRTTLDHAFDMRSSIIQICTWNDWGEGTQIEPSVEFGYRDLEHLQATHRRSIDKRFAAQPDDLRLPHRLYKLRRLNSGTSAKRQLDPIAQLLAAGNLKSARTQLDAIAQ